MAANGRHFCCRLFRYFRLLRVRCAYSFQLRQDADQIAHQADVADCENRSLSVFSDRHSSTGGNQCLRVGYHLSNGKMGRYILPSSFSGTAHYELSYLILSRSRRWSRATRYRPPLKTSSVRFHKTITGTTINMYGRGFSRCKKSVVAQSDIP